MCWDGGIHVMTQHMCACAQIVYYDGQFNDARLNVALAQTAALAGATVLNYTEVKDLIKVQTPEFLIGVQLLQEGPCMHGAQVPYHAG